MMKKVGNDNNSSRVHPSLDNNDDDTPISAENFQIQSKINNILLKMEKVNESKIFSDYILQF